MIEYILNGDSVWVEPENEELFKTQNRDAELASGKSTSSVESVTTGQNTTQIQEANQSQINQQENTEFSWEGGSSGHTQSDFKNFWEIGGNPKESRIKEKETTGDKIREYTGINTAGMPVKSTDDIAYVLNGEKIWVPAEYEDEFKDRNKNALKYDWKEGVDTQAYGKLSETYQECPTCEVKPFIPITAEELVKVAENAPWNKQEDYITSYINDRYKYQNDGNWVQDENGEWALNGNQRVRVVHHRNRIFAGDEFGKNWLRDRVEILTGNQQKGEGIILKWGASRTIFSGEKYGAPWFGDEKKEIGKADTFSQFDAAVFKLDLNLNPDKKHKVNEGISTLLSSKEDGMNLQDNLWGQHHSEFEAGLFHDLDAHQLKSGRIDLEKGIKPDWMTDEAFAEFQRTGKWSRLYKKEQQLDPKLKNEAGEETWGLMDVVNFALFEKKDWHRTDKRGNIPISIINPVDANGDGKQDKDENENLIFEEEIVHVPYSYILNNKQDLRHYLEAAAIPLFKDHLDSKYAEIDVFRDGKKPSWMDEASFNKAQEEYKKTGELSEDFLIDAKKVATDRRIEEDEKYSYQYRFGKDRAIEKIRNVIDFIENDGSMPERLFDLDLSKHGGLWTSKGPKGERQVPIEKIIRTELGIGEWGDLKRIETSEDKEKANLILKHLKEDLKSKMLRDPEKWYDENGNPIHEYSQGEWIEDPDNYGRIINTLSGKVIAGYLVNEDEVEDIAEQGKENPDWLKERLDQAIIRLHWAKKLAHDNMDMIEMGQKGVLELLSDQLGGRFSDNEDKRKIDLSDEIDSIYNLYVNTDNYPISEESLKMILHQADKRTIIDANRSGGLGFLYGMNEIPVIDTYNEALLEYLTFSKAYNLNINPRESWKENWFSHVGKLFQKGFSNKALGDAVQASEIDEIFSGWLEQDLGLVLPEHVVDDSFGWRKQAMQKGSGYRTFADGVGEFGAGFAPLVASLWLTRKPTAALGKATQRGIGKLTNSEALRGLKLKGYKTIDKVFKNYGHTTRLVVKKVFAASWKAVGSVIGGSLRMGGAGASTAVAWGLSEKLTENAFGWKGQTWTKNNDTGEHSISPAFPFFMGASGVLFGAVMGSAHTYLAKQRPGEVGLFGILFPKFHGGKYLQQVSSVSQNTWQGNLMRKYLGIKNPRAIAKTGLSYAGSGFTGAGLLMTTEAIALATDPVVVGTRAAEERKKEWENLTSFDHFAKQFILMSFMGWMHAPGKYREIMEKDAIAFALEPDAITKKLAKEAGVGKPELKNKKYSAAQKKKIDKAKKKLDRESKKLDKEIEKIEQDKKMSAEEKGKKITELEAKKEKIKDQQKKLEAAKNHMIKFNDRVQVRRTAENTQTIYTFLQREFFEKGLLNKIRTGNLDFEDLTAHEIEILTKLDWIDQQSLLYLAGYEWGTKERDSMSGLLNNIASIANNLRGYDISKRTFVGREYLRYNIESLITKEQIKNLKKDTKENPDNEVKNDRKIKRLKKKEKYLEENIEENHKLLEKEYKERLVEEITIAKSGSKEMNTETKQFNTFKEFKAEMLEMYISGKISKKEYEDATHADYVKDEKGNVVEVIPRTDAHFDAKNNIIFINMEGALHSRNIGAPSHELFHRVLKNVLKENGMFYENKWYSEKDLNKLKENKPELYKNILKKNTEIIDGRKRLVYTRATGKRGQKIINHWKRLIGSEAVKLIEKELEERGYMYEEMGWMYEGKRYTNEQLIKMSMSEKFEIQEKLKEIFQLGKESGAGKKIAKELYYEEYLTIYGELIKRGEIERNIAVGKKLGDNIIHPIASNHGIGRNMYRFADPKSRIKDAANDLFDMVETYNTEGITKDIIDFANRTQESTTIKGVTVKEPLRKSRNRGRDFKKVLNEFTGDELRPKHSSKEKFEASGDMGRVWDYLTESGANSAKRKIERDVKDRSIANDIYMKETPYGIIDYLILNLSKKGRGDKGAIERFIQAEANKKGITYAEQEQVFINKVKNRLEEKFGNEYDYDGNPNFFGWLTGVSGGRGESIIHRARGDKRGGGMAEVARDHIVESNILSRELEGGQTTADLIPASKDVKQKMIETEVQNIGQEETVRRSKLRKDVGMSPELMKEVIQTVAMVHGTYLPYIKTGRTLANIEVFTTHKGKRYSKKDLRELKKTNKTLWDKIVKEKEGKEIKEGKVKIDSKNSIVSIVDIKTGKVLFEKKFAEYEFKDLVKQGLIKDGQLVNKGDILVEGYIETMKHAFDAKLRDKMVEMIGEKTIAYEKWLEKHGQAWYEAMDVKTLVKIESGQKKNKVFTYEVERNIGPKKVDLLITDNKLPKGTSRTSGPIHWEKLPWEKVGTKKVIAFHTGKNALKEIGYEVKGNSPNERKSTMASDLSSFFSFDATYQTLLMPEVGKKANEIRELNEQERLDLELNLVMETINREPGIMFSKNKGNIRHIREISGDMIKTDLAFTDIFKQMPNGNWRLIDGGEHYGNKKISQGTIDRLANIFILKETLERGDKFGQLAKKEGGDVWEVINKNGTFNKNNRTLIENVIKPDLRKFFESGVIPYDFLRISGILEGFGFHLRGMDFAARKKISGWSKLSKKEKQKYWDRKEANEDGYRLDNKGEYVPGKDHAFYKEMIKIIEKGKPNAKWRKTVEDAEMMNKDKPLFKEWSKIRFMEKIPINFTYKDKKYKKGDKFKTPAEKYAYANHIGLAERTKKADIANEIIFKHINTELIKAVAKDIILLDTYVSLKQAQSNLTFGDRAWTSLGLIDLGIGSQATYRYKKGNEWVYTDSSSRKVKGETIKNEINFDNPDIVNATRFYENNESKTLKNLTEKGEHAKDNSTSMFNLSQLAVEYKKGKMSEDQLANELDKIYQKHSQILTNKYKCDILDIGGQNNPSHFHRLKFLEKYGPKGNNYIADFVSPRGETYYEFLTRKELTRWEAKNKEKALENKAKLNRSKTIYKNLNQFSKTGKKKGMSTFDFDDTLGMTKSGVRATVPNPSGLPKPGKKVVFLAGGAGSGKGNVIKKLGLEKQGFKIVNQDISLEWLKKNHGLPEDMRDFTKEQKSTLGKLGHQARGIARRKMLKFQGKGEGVVVDGTGGSAKQMEKLVTEFKDKGYDVSMMFVETTLKTALARNKARKERSLLDFIVRKNHEAVQRNKIVFKKTFSNRFMEVKTDNLTMESPMPEKLVKEMNDFVSGYEKLRLDAAEFAERGKEILDKGGKFDFSEFNKVIEGKEGPYLKTAIERAKKFGTKDMFVLTARPPESAKSIHEFLKTMGLDIPLKNIIGLGNSTSRAKAEWMLKKFEEGYNDMYFVDDAFANVKAVKDILNKLDAKSKVVQAKIQFSKNRNKEFNNILQRKFGIAGGRKISLAEAKKLGRGKLKWDYFVPASAEDFKGLLYYFLGKGKQGTADMNFFREALLKPFAEGIRDLTIVKQKMSEEYKTLKKESKDINLNKEIEGTAFTVDNAMRVYLWEKNGFEIKDINPEQVKQLSDYIAANPKLVAYAETLSAITRLKDGYTKPGEFWMVENIASDLNAITRKNLRKEFLAEWIENKNEMFSKDNMNKIEATLGSNYREALENILTRMETGTNRMSGIKDGPTKTWYDWVNGSVGATMFWNTRSAVLQTISTVNFLNWKENNPFAVGKAMLNIPQFSADFAMIFNSPMLKQRRAGLEIDVSASELTNVFETHGRSPKAILNYLLQKGFTPTRIADSFAIAAGGAPYYRNRYNMYIKQGLSKIKAREKAWLDFQEMAEETQQSSRPDLISQQQAGPLGRVILAWQNTPMQMTRLMKKSLSDLVNRRISEPGQTQWQSDRSNISRILYYGAIQNFWFYTLQSGLGWLMFGSDDEDLIAKKELQVANGAFDTLLRGTGIYGAAVSTLKNTILQLQKQQKKKYGQQDYGKVTLEMINVSPPIGSKVRKVYNAINTWKYNEGVAEELPWHSIENPNYHAIANIIEATTNAPVARVLNKANNLEEAISGDHEMWVRSALMLGWYRWNLGVEDKELEEAKTIVKQKKKEKKKDDKKKKKKDDEKKDEKTEKVITCTAYTKSGKRCKNKTSNKNKKCWNHQGSSTTKKTKSETKKSNEPWGKPL